MAAKGDWADVFLFMIRTGLRLGEVEGLSWRDVDLARRTMRVRQQRMDDGDVSTPKRGAGRTVDLAWDVVEMLRERGKAKQDEHVFGGVTDRSVWWVFATSPDRGRGQVGVHAGRSSSRRGRPRPHHRAGFLEAEARPGYGRQAGARTNEGGRVGVRSTARPSPWRSSL